MIRAGFLGLAFALALLGACGVKAPPRPPPPPSAEGAGAARPPAPGPERRP